MPRLSTARFQLSGRSVVFIAAALLLLASAAGFLTYQLRFDSQFVWLSPQNGAEWIRFDRPMSTIPHDSRKLRTIVFRTTVDVDKTVRKAVLTYRSLRQAAVRWDGQVLSTPLGTSAAENWKQDRQVPLPVNIPPGRYDLQIVVANNDGPPALLAFCHSLGLFTSKAWQARENDARWSEVLTVDEVRAPAISRRFGPAHQYLTKLVPLVAVVVCLVAVMPWVGKHLPLKSRIGQFTFSAGQLRWLLIVAWTVLAVNNNRKTTLSLGFDAQQHWQYISYIVENKTLPLATLGWQMFQSPLYYLLSAITFSTFYVVCDAETAARLTRFIPLMCGLIQVELCYRGLRYLFPQRNDLQCLGLLLGGLLPMNLYISQGFSNEPLTGVFSSAAVVLSWRFLRDPTAARSRRLQVFLGLLLGLALLSKVTPILLVAPVVLMLIYTLHRSGCSWQYVTIACSRVLGICLLVAGWYYLGNWIELGRPFVGGWDANRNIDWWQDPGYRVIEQLTSFGECLEFPIYAAGSGFWDGIYSSFWLDGFLSSWIAEENRSAWNATFLISGAWLGLVPTLAILLGGGLAPCNSNKVARAGLLFSVLVVGIYLAAMLYLWLKVPFYSNTKATYTLGLIPCYAALGAAGFDWLTRHPVFRTIVYGYMTGWALCAYFAYFVLR